MSLPIFYIPPEHFDGDAATLTGDELRHARLTLRLGPGDRALVVDGEGTLCEGTFSSMEKAQGVLQITSRTREAEPAFSLTIAMGIVAGERFDWALQKGTELGASAFIPLLSRRTEVKASRPWKRLERLRRVVVSACKQCGRARFPTLSEPVALHDLSTAGYDLALAFWESDRAAPLSEAAGRVQRPASCLMIIGPVGGFAPEEAEILREKGCLLAGLGPRILRTETAVTAGAALVQYLWGDMG
ncbi:MAG: 16S rRNA (uracil(1498)-N(3))-methyltransferase [bacterium]|nr:MAG: 16S rRNA (uracil(1498)-N(3))-methyltransferase [bacterium]